MARVPVTIYKNSFLATFVSVVGTFLAIMGIVGLIDFDVGHVVQATLSLAGGIGLMILASAISQRAAEKKSFKLWVKRLEQEGIVDKMVNSEEVCMQIYQAHTGKRTLQFIAKYNPAAAEKIAASTQEKSPEKANV